MMRHLGRQDATILWNYMLIGLNSKSGRIAARKFNLIMNVLNELYKKSIPQKQCIDLVTRLFIELPKVTIDELVQLCQHCIDSIRIQSSKCTGYGNRN